MPEGIGGEILTALGQASKRVGKSLGADAGAAVKKLYVESRSKLDDVIKRSVETDGARAGEIKKIAEDMRENAAKSAVTDAEKAEKAATQTALHKKLSSILGGDGETSAVKHDLENEHLPSHTLEPPEGHDKVPWIGNNAKDGTKIGQLPEKAVTRDENGLITHVNGESVDSYMSRLAHERRGMYEDAKAAGTFSGSKTGAATAVGVDRRTGGVYEGYNGKPRVDVISPDNAHDTLTDQVKAMHNPGGYLDPQKHAIDYPGTDEPLGHAEVKAANAMLQARDAAGLPSDANALKEMSFAPHFPGNTHPEAKTCPNCTQLLDGSQLPYGSRVDYSDVWSS